MHRLIECLAVCGPHAPGQESSHVLGCIPPRVEGDVVPRESLASFCFPNGTLVPDEDVPKEPQFHSFVLTREDGSRLYGGALVYYLQTPTDPTPQALCCVSRLGLFSSMELLLRGVYGAANSKGRGGPSVEAVVYSLVYEVAMPEPSSRLLLLLGGSKVEICRPPPVALPMYDGSVVNLFRHITIDHLLRLVMCLLTSQRIVLRSTTPRVLAAVGEGLQALMWPFAWCHAYVPVLPAAMYHCLEAPVPYLMGVVCTGSSLPCGDDAVHVDLDGRVVYLPCPMPLLPCHTDLEQQLASLLRLDSKGIPAELPANQSRARSDQIRKLFAQSFASIMAGYEDYLIVGEEGDSPQFDTVAFLCDQNPDDVPCMVELLQSQSFASFLDSKCASYRGAEVPAIAYYDHLVAGASGKKPPPMPHVAVTEKTISVGEGPMPLGLPRGLKGGNLALMDFGKFPALGIKGQGRVRRAGLTEQREKRKSWSAAVAIPKRSPLVDEDDNEEGEINEGLVDEVLQTLKGIVGRLCASYEDRERQGATMACTRKDREAKRRYNAIERLRGAGSQSSLNLAQRSQAEIEEGSSSTSKEDGQWEHVQRQLERQLDGEVSRLCALLEHVWVHGRRGKCGRSALGSHLMQCRLEEGSHAATDRDRIMAVNEIKTRTGQGRAFVRLSVEKGTLESNMRELLKDAALLESSYKPYAILRQQKAVDQILAAIEPLHRVRVSCFSGKEYARAIAQIYRIAIATSDQSNATTSANAMCSLQGPDTKSQRILLPRTLTTFARGGTSEFEVEVPFAGPVTRLVLGHDNSGLYPAWHVDHVVVEHVATGMAYMFPCHKWLAQGEAGTVSCVVLPCDSTYRHAPRPFDPNNSPLLARACKTPSSRRRATAMYDGDSQSNGAPGGGQDEGTNQGARLAERLQDRWTQGSAPSSPELSRSRPGSSHGRGANSSHSTHSTHTSHSSDSLSGDVPLGPVAKLMRQRAGSVGGQTRRASEPTSSPLAGRQREADRTRAPMRQLSLQPSPANQNTPSATVQSSSASSASVEFQPMVHRESVPEGPVAMAVDKAGHAVDSIINYFLQEDVKKRPDYERVAGTLLRDGLAASLLAVLELGFRSTRLFRTPLHVWDFIEKVECGVDDMRGGDSLRQAVALVGATGKSLQTSQKFEWFVYIGAKKQMLAHWLRIMLASDQFARFYDINKSISDDEGCRELLLCHLDRLACCSIEIPLALMQ